MEGGPLLIGIVEKDTNADVILSWSYPLIDDALSKVLVTKSRLQEEQNAPEAFFSKYKESWIYVCNSCTPSPSLPKVVAFSIVLLSKAFNPEKYLRLAELISERYSSTGSPPRALEAYLGVYAADRFDFGQGNLFKGAEFDDRKALFRSSLKGLFSTFGMESAIIYLAMILKKRIVVYSSQLPLLLDTVRSLPLLVWHRKNWGLLRPYVKGSKEESEELFSSPVYVAGFLDRLIESRDDLYDLFVDIDSRTITVASHAKNDFLLGKPLKELGLLMLKLGEDEAITDQQIIKEVALKTKEFLDLLGNHIAEGESKVSLETIQGAELPPAMLRFLWNLAIAEDKAQM